MEGLIEWSVLVESALHRPPLLRCNGKAPLDAGWTTGPWEHPDEWRQRLVGHTSNVGMVTGRGLLIIDADTYKPGGQESLDALVEATGIDLNTVTQLTGRDGRHFGFSYDAAIHVPSVPLEPLGFPCIEVKADGGQVIVEPSVHPDTGREYRFEAGYAPGEIDLQPATLRLLQLVGAMPGGTATSSRRWSPLDDAAMAALDQSDVEAARLLVEHFGGHSPALLHGGVIGVWRPGKTDGNTSVTIGFLGPGVCKVWTDGWPPFVQGKVYDLGQLRDMAGVAPTITVPTLELPAGYRLWRPGDADRRAPVLDNAARYGLVGRYLELVDHETEASAAPIGATLLTEIGTLIGRQATVHIGEHHHHANLFVLVVGETSTGGKGSADNTVDRLVRQVDSSFAIRHVIGGFGSGEAVVNEVRDTNGDEEPNEKRRVIIEAEFASVLRVAQRDHSILSQIVRQAFDYKPLQHRTKTYGRVVATDHHLSIIGSITPAELASCSTLLDVENGWLNRFMLVHSEIVRVLPFGGRIDDLEVRSIAAGVRDAVLALAKRPTINGSVDYFIRDHTDAGALWQPWYRKVRFGSGTIGALTRRQHVHVPRIALILAVLDQAPEITVDHLRAAMAWSDFAVATVEYLFGQSATGRAAQLLQAIRETRDDGLDGAGQHAVFGRHLDAPVLAALREELEQARLIATFTMPSGTTGGRPRVLSFAISPVRIAN